MSEQAISRGEQRSGGAQAEHAALVGEIARQQEEILRLRDLLIAKNAELGAAKGRLAELTEHSARLVVAARRLQALGPGILGRIAARLRRRG